MEFWKKDIANIEFDLESRDEIPKLLMGLQYIYRSAPIRKAVFNVIKQIVPKKNHKTGRPGMDLWKILVLGTLRLNCNWDFDKVHEMANNHHKLRQMLGHSKTDFKSLYALQTKAGALVTEPFKSFKELPDSMPYTGAFANRTEQALIPYVDRLASARLQVIDHFDGSDAPAGVSGDFALVVRPLPKIALCYVGYAADEDFPAAVTCLYSRNADQFLSTDALADLGEYTTRAIKALL